MYAQPHTKHEKVSNHTKVRQNTKLLRKIKIKSCILYDLLCNFLGSIGLIQKAFWTCYSQMLSTEESCASPPDTRKSFLQKLLNVASIFFFDWGKHTPATTSVRFGPTDPTACASWDPPTGARGEPGKNA